jgi:hypothetical protein
MTSRGMILLAAAAFGASTVACSAGPCTQDITKMEIAIDARLNARAAAGPSGTESTAAMMHRQPTPQSIAEAERKLGDLSQQTINTVRQAVANAKAADQAGDLAGCKRALAEVEKAINP